MHSVRGTFYLAVAIASFATHTAWRKVGICYRLDLSRLNAKFMWTTLLLWLNGELREPSLTQEECAKAEANDLAARRLEEQHLESALSSLRQDLKQYAQEQRSRAKKGDKNAQSWVDIEDRQLRECGHTIEHPRLNDTRRYTAQTVRASSRTIRK